MHLSTLFLALTLLFSGAFADASCKRRGGGHGSCLPHDKVNMIVSNYQAIVGDIKSLSTQEIDDIIHAEFVDWSNSISAFFFAPYNEPAFASKEAFVNAQLAAPSQVPIVIESVPAVTCDTVVIVWNTNAFPSTGQPSRGIAVVQVAQENALWKIKRVDVEFNSLAWAAGVGGGYVLFNQTVGDVGC